MTFAQQQPGPMAPRAPVRTAPDVERLRALADRAVAVHEAVRVRTMGATCAPA